MVVPLMVLALLSINLWLLALPFEDTMHRFRLELPEGWSWTPQPGDTNGAWFKKTDTGAIARMGVRVLVDTSLDQALAAATRMVHREPGYRLISEGRPAEYKGATKRELVYFVGATDKVQKRIEQLFLTNGRVTYWLHFEALAEGYDLFTKDRDAIYRSFTPIAGGQRVQIAGDKAKKLLGLWRREDDGFMLDFNADGSYVLGALSGQFLVDANEITFLRMGGSERFFYSFIGEQLVLSANEGASVRYRRVPKRVDKPLYGRWRAKEKDARVILMSPGGSFEFGDAKGTYRAADDLLTFRRVDGAEVTYVYLLDEDTLKLSGGDLKGEVIFLRE